MSKKLLVMLVTGIAAGHFDEIVGNLSNFRHLHESGFSVNRLESAALSSPLAARTVLLTGDPSPLHDICANPISHYPSPDDVSAPTLAARVRSAGLKVASIGMGMVRPEDADIFIAPWWASALIQSESSPPANDGWLRAIRYPASDELIALCQRSGVSWRMPEIHELPEDYQHLYSMYANNLMADWVGLLAVSDDAPDLILTEYLTPDSFVPDASDPCGFLEWSLEQADLALGEIMLRLEQAGVLDDWNIVVLGEPRQSRFLADTALGCDHQGFALFAGASVPKGQTVTADLPQISSTLAMLLGISSHDFASNPVFDAFEELQPLSQSTYLPLTSLL